MLIAVSANAQCVAEITDVIQDVDRGSIIVETDYTINSVLVQEGRTRYLETSGTNAEIVAKAKADVLEHCGNLIRRIEANAVSLRAEKLAEQKSLTTPIITAIKSSLVGHEETVSSVKDTFKGKEITVDADSKTTIKVVTYTRPVTAVVE